MNCFAFYLSCYQTQRTGCALSPKICHICLFLSSSCVCLFMPYSLVRICVHADAQLCVCLCSVCGRGEGTLLCFKLLTSQNTCQMMRRKTAGQRRPQRKAAICSSLLTLIECVCACTCVYISAFIHSAILCISGAESGLIT